MLLLVLLQALSIINGVITSADGVVPGATVISEETGRGAVADVDGSYRLELPPGRHTLVFSALGHQPRRETVDVEGAMRLDVELSPTVLMQDEVVITGTMRETYVSESPVKVEVVPRAFFDRVGANNVMDAMNYVSGLQVQVECGICYTNNIRINGMDGPYTAVLIDGTPIMSSLATVYGLNSISPSLVRQVEIIRGPSSTLYGSEALAGIINIRTQRPDHAPRLFVQARTSSDLETSVDASTSFERGRIGGLLSASGTWMDNFIDANDDAFSDVPLVRRLSLFGKIGRGDALDSQLAARVYLEDRWGGQRGWTRRDRGSDTIYGESILTRRLELLGSHRFDSRTRLDAAYNLHDQDSYYGDVRFQAHQQTLYATLSHSRSIVPEVNLLLGATTRLDDYRDDTPVTNADERRFVPGVFAQMEVEPASRLSIIGGGRLDRHRNHGIIVSPRLSARYRPGPETTLRLNAGTGFRVVNLFTEDHAALTGSRRIVLEEAIAPERSWNVTINLNHIIPFGANPLVIDADVFQTYFSNRIVPDYDADPASILYRNLDGHAITRGATLNLSQSFTSIPLDYSVGLTLLDARLVQAEVSDRITFAPRIQGVFTASYRDPRTDVTFDYSSRLTGPMRMPEYAPPFARPSTSSAFSVHNLQLTRKLSHYQEGGTHRDVEAFAGVNNLFGYVQASPLVDPENPFGEHFDTTYIYGPLRGRTFTAGLRFVLE